MLDLDARCPKCGDKLLGADERCDRCHASFKPKRGAYVRIRAIMAAVFVVLAAVGAALAWPAELRAQLEALRHPRGSEQLSTRIPWAYGGDEPTSRAWAFPLEPSLVTACKETHARLVGPKYMSAFIAYRIFAAEKVAAAAEQRAPKWRALTTEEEQDAIGSVGSVESFTAACVRWGYAAVVPCIGHAGSLKGDKAEACLVPPVQAAITIEPWLRCAYAAKLEPVRRTCREVAEHFVQKAGEARGQADAKKPPVVGPPGA